MYVSLIRAINIVGLTLPYCIKLKVNFNLEVIFHFVMYEKIIFFMNKMISVKGQMVALLDKADIVRKLLSLWSTDRRWLGCVS